MPSTRCVNDGQQPADTERREHQSSEPPDCVKLRAITKSDEQKIGLELIQEVLIQDRILLIKLMHR